MTDQYPAVPWYKPGSPETAIAAAESMRETAPTIRAKIKRVVADAGAYGYTSDEVAERVGLDNPFSSRPRLSELLASREIADSGRRRRNRSGRNAVVWVLPEYAPLSEDMNPGDE